MDEETFKERTKKFGLTVIQLVETLPRSRTADIIGRRLLRCGTSVGANYRAACWGRSISDVIAKLGVVEEEADESMYWLDLLVDSHIVPREQAGKLRDEADQLVAMTVASIKTLRGRKQNSQGGSSDSGFHKQPTGIRFQNPKSKI